MINSWWELAEWSGYPGAELNIRNLVCPFCFESGNFKTAYHAEKKKSNSEKKLNFDTFKCENCAGYVLVFWTTAEFSSAQPIYDYRVIPFPIKINKAPDEWPEEVGRYWIQAKRNIIDENWDAASVMARSSMQVALRDNGAKGKNLLEEINDLSKIGILPPIMKEWSNTVRELGNESAHPKPGQEPTQKLDAVDVVNFLDFLLEYLYSLPKKINDLRERKK